MANEFGNINPWWGALQGAIGSLRYAGDQPWHRAGFGQAFGGGTDQAMGFYQTALQGQLIKRRIQEQEREKLVWQNVGDALKGGQPDLNAIGDALISGGTADTIRSGLALKGQLARAEFESQQKELDRQTEQKRLDWQAEQNELNRKAEKERWDKYFRMQRDVAGIRNPLAGLMDNGFIEPTFPGTPTAPVPNVPRPATAPTPRPAATRAPTPTTLPEVTPSSEARNVRDWIKSNRPVLLNPERSRMQPEEARRYIERLRVALGTAGQLRGEEAQLAEQGLQNLLRLFPD